MSIRHSVYIVASPRPRVGKTLLSRLLIDYHKHEGREFGAFDLNSGDHTLKQFAPDDVTAANIGSVKGQMALFDSLVSEQGGGKVVDVGGDAYKNFFDVAYRIGLVEEAHKRDIAPVILFIVSSDKQAADAYRDLRTRFPGAALTPGSSGPPGTVGVAPVGASGLRVRTDEEVQGWARRSGGCSPSSTP